VLDRIWDERMLVRVYLSLWILTCRLVVLVLRLTLAAVDGIAVDVMYMLVVILWK
jgi:hypothetical protein